MHQKHDLQLKMYQKAFGGLAPPEPAPQTASGFTVGVRREREEEGKGEEGWEKKRHPTFANRSSPQGLSFNLYSTFDV